LTIITKPWCHVTFWCYLKLHSNFCDQVVINIIEKFNNHFLNQSQNPRCVVMLIVNFNFLFWNHCFSYNSLLVSFVTEGISFWLIIDCMNLLCELGHTFGITCTIRISCKRLPKLAIWFVTSLILWINFNIGLFSSKVMACSFPYRYIIDVAFLFAYKSCNMIQHSCGSFASTM
jgi:hypothetical protein